MIKHPRCRQSSDWCSTRTLTDFAYCAYLADLAVDKAYQRKGIGKHLIELRAKNLEPTAYIALLAAPKASKYYSKVGFEHNPRAWMMKNLALGVRDCRFEVAPGFRRGLPTHVGFSAVK